MPMPVPNSTVELRICTVFTARYQYMGTVIVGGTVLARNHRYREKTGDKGAGYKLCSQVRLLDLQSVVVMSIEEACLVDIANL